MKVKGLVPGFKFLYATDDADVAVVRFSAEGLRGLVGLSRLDWVITRHDSDSIIRCCVELLGKAPIWAVENGDVEAAQAEVDRWANPILYEAIRMARS